MLLGILKLQSDTTPCHIFQPYGAKQRNSELTFWGWGIPGRNNFIAPNG